MTALVHENHLLESVEVSDAYLAAWLLINGCTIVQCTWRPHAGPLGGLMVFAGARAGAGVLQPQRPRRGMGVSCRLQPHHPVSA